MECVRYSYSMIAECLDIIDVGGWAYCNICRVVHTNETSSRRYAALALSRAITTAVGAKSCSQT